MTDSLFRYIFRFCCDPGFNDRQETDSLIRFADEAGVDDVAVFANVEELNTGHMTAKEQEIFLSLIRDVSARLKSREITVSVNQWHSVMHADLGKELPPEQPFRRMVDPYGNEAKLCVCPLCAEWQKYIGGIYAAYAELDASVLWVEDDFRLHNHDPLIWGGCFCEEHMRLYSKAAGKELTREEFVAGILQPGPVHPYRKIWLDVSRQTMLSAARAINRAIRSSDPGVKIGLMSSVPFVHAAEGRDWDLLLNTLSGGAIPVSRIHLPAYQEQVPSSYMRRFNMVSMQCAAMLPRPCEIYPELENYPYSLFSKSRRFTRFQLLSSLPLDLRGMTIDLFDLNGNGIVFGEGYQHMLKQTKPYLNRLQEKGVFGCVKTGVRVLYSPDSSYTLKTVRGKSMEELYPHDVFFAGLLGNYGIPFFYSSDIRCSGETVAVSGQVFRNFTAGEIMELFRNNTVLMNGDAAYTLYDMGLGSAAGISSVRWLKQNGGEHTYEQITCGRTYLEHPNARASTVISCSDVLDIIPLPDTDVHEYSAFFDSFRRRTAPAEAVLNGRVILFPFGHFESPDDIPPMLLNSVRRAVLQDMLRESGFGGIMANDDPHLFVYCYEKADTVLAYIINAGMDDLDRIVLNCTYDIRSVTVTGSHTEDEHRSDFTRTGDRLDIDTALPSMEAVLLEIR